MTHRKKNTLLFEPMLGNPSKDPPQSARYNIAVVFREIWGGPFLLGPTTMPRDARLSDRCTLNPFFPSVAFSQPSSQHLLSERLTSLGIMGEARVPPLNPSETIVLWEHYRLMLERWAWMGYVPHTYDSWVVTLSSSHNAYCRLSLNHPILFY